MIKFPFIPTTLFLFFVVLMTSLGFWQLNRAQEKEQLLVLLADDKISQITQISQIKSLPKYANVEIKGHFINSPQFLLDNQIDNKVIGYHVFTPFKIDGENSYLMINRGWLSKKEYHSDLTDIESLQISISGKLNSPPQVGIQLGEVELLSDKSPQVITYYDQQKMPSFLHEAICDSLNCIVSDKILLLDKSQEYGYKREWKPIIMLPEKHIGYAIQWFAMTIVLIIIFIFWLRKHA